MNDTSNNKARDLINKLSKTGIPPIGFEDKTHIQEPEFPNKKLSIKLSAKEQWESLLWNIQTAEAHGTRALNGLTIALVNIIRGEMLENLLFDVREGSAQKYTIEDLLWDKELPIRNDGSTLDSLLEKDEGDLNLDLSHSAIIPQPWKQWRLHRSLQNLGVDAKWGKWVDNSNVGSIAWKPWPIVWVNNGNHSTMAAILTHGGDLEPKEVYDAKELLASVYTDGIHWIRTDNHQVIDQVKSLAMAGIFEIGKRLLKPTSANIT